MDISTIVIIVLVLINLGLIFCLTRKDGFMRLDTSNPDKDCYLLELKIDLEDIPKKKYINLKVDTKYHKPQ